MRTSFDNYFSHLSSHLPHSCIARLQLQGFVPAAKRFPKSKNGIMIISKCAKRLKLVEISPSLFGKAGALGFQTFKTGFSVLKSVQLLFFSESHPVEIRVHNFLTLLLGLESFLCWCTRASQLVRFSFPTKSDSTHGSHGNLALQISVKVPAHPILEYFTLKGRRPLYLYPLSE